MKKKLLCAILAGTMILSVPVYAKDLSVTVPSYVTDAGLSDFPDSQESSTADDGSMVYTLNKDQQKKWKEYLKSSLDAAIKDVLSDKETYPNIEDMTYNDDMTKFNINISSADNMTMSEAFVGYLPLFFAPLYQEVNGIDEDKVDYKIISTDSSTGDKYESDYKQNKADWILLSFPTAQLFLVIHKILLVKTLTQLLLNQILHLLNILVLKQCHMTLHLQILSV